MIKLSSLLLIEGVISIHPKDKLAIDKYISEMNRACNVLIKQHNYSIEGNELAEELQKISNKLKSNKFPFNIQYDFSRGLASGYYDKKSNTIGIVLRESSKWNIEKMVVSNKKYKRYMCYSVNWEHIASTFMHEFSHYIQHIYRTEKQGHYDLPTNWSTNNYFKRGWERQAHAIGYLERLRKSFDLKTPKELLYWLKKSGLVTSELLHDLKTSDPRSWKAIMKQAAMTALADMENV